MFRAGLLTCVSPFHSAFPTGKPTHKESQSHRPVASCRGRQRLQWRGPFPIFTGFPSALNAGLLQRTDANYKKTFKMSSSPSHQGLGTVPQKATSPSQVLNLAEIRRARHAVPLRPPWQVP